MQAELKTFIDYIRTNRRIDSFDESAIKQAVILKMLNCLGWDTYNVDEVKPEYSVSGKRVDFSLRIDNQNKVFLEVKRPGEDLDNHQEQLLQYSFQEGVKMAILTNGITWHFYLPLNEGSWEQRRFYTIDVLQQNSDDTASKFADFLSRENTKTSRSIENAQKVYSNQKKTVVLQEAILKAWNSIVEEANDLLLDLLSETTEKICGFKPDAEFIEQFLAINKSSLLLSRGYRSESSFRTTTSTTVGGNYTGKSPHSFSFQGSKYEVRSWKELLMKFCKVILNKRSDFNKVLDIVGRKRPYFTHKLDELRSPEKISNTNIYVETNMSANHIVKICLKVLEVFNYSTTDFKINAS